MSLSENSFILKNDGTLWGCGTNDLGTLGLGDTTNRTTFTQATTNTNDIESIYCGYDYAFILKNDNTLWGCGRNAEGQLGLGDTTNRTTFTKITDNVKSVYCGYNHTIILKKDGTLWGCGQNDDYELGLGDVSSRTTFTKITINADNVKSVYCGWNHTIILKNDGTLWACGYNAYGQLGLGDVDTRKTFTEIFINANDVKSICCGRNHTFILKNDNTLWGCGDNQYGQLGLGDKTSRITFAQITAYVDNINSIYCGVYHTVILKNDSTLWGCGFNDYGQLGLNNTTSRTTFTQITTNADDIQLVYCGNYFTFILKKDGTLWGCGYNEDGRLGLGSGSNKKIFTQVTANADNIKNIVNYYPIAPSTIKIYDSKIGYAETLDTNNFRNIPINTIEKLKSLCIKPVNTYLNCLISFDKKQTWKTFDGTDWTIVSDISPQNIILNGMEVSGLNSLDKQKLISGGFTGDLDFKIAMKTNDKNKTPSITKIYIEYK